MNGLFVRHRTLSLCGGRPVLKRSGSRNMLSHLAAQPAGALSSKAPNISIISSTPGSGTPARGFSPPLPPRAPKQSTPSLPSPPSSPPISPPLPPKSPKLNQRWKVALPASPPASPPPPPPANTFTFPQSVSPLASPPISPPVTPPLPPRSPKTKQQETINSPPSAPSSPPRTPPRPPKSPTAKQRRMINPIPASTAPSTTATQTRGSSRRIPKKRSPPSSPPVSPEVRAKSSTSKQKVSRQRSKPRLSPPPSPPPNPPPSVPVPGFGKETSDTPPNYKRPLPQPPKGDNKEQAQPALPARAPELSSVGKSSSLESDGDSRAALQKALQEWAALPPHQRLRSPPPSMPPPSPTTSTLANRPLPQPPASSERSPKVAPPKPPRNFPTPKTRPEASVSEVEQLSSQVLSPLPSPQPSPGGSPRSSPRQLNRHFVFSGDSSFEHFASDPPPLPARVPRRTSEPDLMHFSVQPQTNVAIGNPVSPAIAQRLSGLALNIDLPAEYLGLPKQGMQRHHSDSCLSDTLAMDDPQSQSAGTKRSAENVLYTSSDALSGDEPMYDTAIHRPTGSTPERQAGNNNVAGKSISPIPSRLTAPTSMGSPPGRRKRLSVSTHISPFNLPDGWSCCWSERGQAYYYYNHSLQLTTWKHPQTWASTLTMHTQHTSFDSIH